MNWLAPAMFVGALALAAPILAHLLGRREPRTIEFPAMRFVNDAKPHVDQRPRLRDPLLFALRVAAMLLIVFALARPVTLEERDLPVFGAGAVMDDGIYASSSYSIELKRKMRSVAGEAFFVADSSKFGREALFKVFGFEDFTAGITDDGIDPIRAAHWPIPLIRAPKPSSSRKRA